MNCYSHTCTCVAIMYKHTHYSVPSHITALGGSGSDLFHILTTLLLWKEFCVIVRSVWCTCRLFLPLEPSWWKLTLINDITFCLTTYHVCTCTCVCYTCRCNIYHNFTNHDDCPPIPNNCLAFLHLFECMLVDTCLCIQYLTLSACARVTVVCLCVCVCWNRFV